MKNYFLITLVLIAFFCCKKKEIKTRYFSVDKLEALKLDSFNVLFGDIEVVVPGPFKSYNGYIDGMGFENSKDGIFISVFNSQVDALEAMHHRIDMVSCVIEEGVGEELEPEWWSSECVGRHIFKNHWNTIIEISSFAPYRENADELIFETVKEVMQRVDKLSEPMVLE